MIRRRAVERRLARRLGWLCAALGQTLGWLCAAAFALAALAIAGLIALHMPPLFIPFLVFVWWVCGD